MPDGYGEPVVTDHYPKCWKCSRTLAEYLTRPWSVRCRRCSAPNKLGDEPPFESP